MILKHPKICYSLIQQAAESIFVADHENRVIFQNTEAKKVFGFDDDEILGHSILEKIHRHYPDGSDVPLEHCKVYRAAAFGETARDFTWLVSRRDGSRFYASCSASPLIIDGRNIGAIFFATDITARKNAEDALRAVAEQLQLASEVAGVGLYDYRPQTGEMIWSDTLKQQFGLPPEAEATLDTYYAALHPEDRERARATVEDIYRSGHAGSYQIEYRAIGLADGRERWIVSRGQVFFDEQGRPARQIGATLEITDRKRAEESLLQAARHCPLTGLPNRALLAEYTEHLFAMAERDQAECAVLFIDLDRFKPVNDRHGHEAGDRVLQEVTKRLRRCTRREDVISRIGGDEFVVVLPHIDTASDPQTVARHIVDSIELPIPVDDGRHHARISASIGISVYPKHGKDLDTLLKCADQAMYSAKRGGGNAVRIYIPGDGERASARLELENHLRHALDAGRLALLYQPIVDIQTGKPSGAEALIRLAGMSGDLLEPAQFIPIAEDAGLIERVGRWVAQEACRQYQAWREAGLPPFSIAINVSPAEFRQRRLAQHLAQAIEASGMDPACLQIEITEAAVMENIGEAADILKELRAMGVRIALDNFGAGYSSLGHLSTLPLDKLKIDQSFIGKLGASPASRAVADTILGLGRLMELQVAGEGVESPEALEYLREHGCNQAQGYLYSKPLPADEFEAWYRGRNKQLH